MTAVYGWVSAVAGSPSSKGKENIVRKEASAYKNFVSLKCLSW
jgi:hypothetical protein